MRVRPPCASTSMILASHPYLNEIWLLTAAKRRIRPFADVCGCISRANDYREISGSKSAALIDQIQETKWVLERLLTLLQSGARRARPSSSLTSISPGAGIVGLKRSLEKSSKRSLSGASPLPFQVAERVAFKEALSNDHRRKKPLGPHRLFRPSCGSECLLPERGTAIGCIL